MTHHHPATACLQELCDANLAVYLAEVKALMYDSSGRGIMSSLAPVLMDICDGMLYLHARHIVHGGRDCARRWELCTAVGAWEAGRRVRSRGVLCPSRVQQ